MIAATKPMAVYRQRGFSLVTAIFVLVVLSLLGVYMVTIGSAQRVTVSYAIQNARADSAARSGIDWGIFEAMRAVPNCPATTTFNLTAPGFQGFSVTVLCSSTIHREFAPPDFQVFTLTSTATYGAYGDPYFFSRTVQASVTNAP